MVDHIEHGHGDDSGHVEPQRYVEARLIAFGHGPEEIDCEHDPDEDHCEVDRPDEFGVFLAAGEAGGQRQCGGHDDELPTPKVDGREHVRGGTHLAQTLRRVVYAGKHHVADKGENHRVGVQWPQPPKRQIGNTVRLDKRPPIPTPFGCQPVMQRLGHYFQNMPVHLPPRELAAHQHPEGHADDSPKNRGNHEAPHRCVVVSNGGGGHGRGRGRMGWTMASEGIGKVGRVGDCWGADCFEVKR